MLIRTRCLPFTLKKSYLISLAIAALIIYLFTLCFYSGKVYKRQDFTTSNDLYFLNNFDKNLEKKMLANAAFQNKELKLKIIQEKVKYLEKKFQKYDSIRLNNKAVIKPNYNIHIFYYAWYNNIKIDGYYKHWNHKYMENWKKDTRRIFPSGIHIPPDDISSNYFPNLGCYSSNDPYILDIHLKQIRDAGIGVISISWTPPNFADSPSDMLQMFFDKALKYQIKISLHIEPYHGRNPINLRDHLTMFFKQYGQHSALYRTKSPKSKKNVPVIYIYDSYLTPAVAWKELFSRIGNLSVRDTEIDAIYLGLLVEIHHRYHIKKAHFDGFYTYFATNSFTYGSTWKNWEALSKFAAQSGLMFVPSVGPGYIDTRIRPWNAANTRHRRNGQYYDVAWRSAINSNPDFVSITSFNEWHEGTQIEPAKSKSVAAFTYLDYEPQGPFYYLNLTKSWVYQFEMLLN